MRPTVRGALATWPGVLPRARRRLPWRIGTLGSMALPGAVMGPAGRWWAGTGMGPDDARYVSACCTGAPWPWRPAMRSRGTTSVPARHGSAGEESKDADAVPLPWSAHARMPDPPDANIALTHEMRLFNGNARHAHVQGFARNQPMWRQDRHRRHQAFPQRRRCGPTALRDVLRGCVSDVCVCVSAAVVRESSAWSARVDLAPPRARARPVTNRYRAPPASSGPGCGDLAARAAMLGDPPACACCCPRMLPAT